MFTLDHGLHEFTIRIGLLQDHQVWGLYCGAGCI